MIKSEYQNVRERHLKKCTPNWIEEVFIIDKMQYTNPIAYKTKDLSDKGITPKNNQKPHKMFSEVMRCFQMRLFGEITRRNKLW